MSWPWWLLGVTLAVNIVSVVVAVRRGRKERERLDPPQEGNNE